MVEHRRFYTVPVAGEAEELCFQVLRINKKADNTVFANSESPQNREIGKNINAK